MQERRNSIANALELRLSCTNQSIYGTCVWSSLCLLMIYNFIMLNHWQAVMTEKFNILIEVLVAIKYF